MGNCVNVYAPVSLERTSRRNPLSRFVMVMVAPVTIAWLASVTMPATLAVCANATAAPSSTSNEEQCSLHG